MGRHSIRRTAELAALHGGPPLPLPESLDDLGPILARWPMMLTYDAASGELWLRYVMEGRNPETLAPEEYQAARFWRANNKDRKVVRVDGFTVETDKVVWLFHHRRWPERRIVHINGDRFDDRIENLRLADEPQRFGRVRKRPVGVAKYYDRWQAYAPLGNGRNKNLGVFKTLEAAAAARKAWDDAQDLV